MSYTDEQYRKDKKRLIGAGLLICAFLIFLLHSWNMRRLEERRIERERIEIERQAENIIEQPATPALRDLFDFERNISPEIMDEIIRQIGKNEAQYQEKRFRNFRMTISTEWQEIKREELERVFPGINYEIRRANAEILFLVHNFNIEKIVIDMLKRKDARIIGMLDIGELDFFKVGLQEIILFNIIEFREVGKVDDFIRIIKELDARNEYFKIIEKNVVEKDENEIRIEAKLSFPQKIDGRIQEIKIYSYKKIILIDKNLYAFIFLSDSEIIGENRKEVDKILESVIIN